MPVYGDSHVDPAVLFDPAGDIGPAADALDVQLRAPISLSLFAAALDRTGNPGFQSVQQAYEQVMAETMVKLQHCAGYVLAAGRGGFPVSEPARLELAILGETAVPGIDTLRLHCHLYVGATAATLTDGARWPVDVEGLRRSVYNVLWPFYANRLEAAIELVTGCTWGQPRPGAALEIVDPPFHEHLTDHERGVCPGPWGPRRLLLADEQSLRLAAERERHVARDHARGIRY